jgi:hypothetical protein
MDQLMIRISPPSLFRSPPTLFFQPDISGCPCCGSVLQVEKTRTKKVVTLTIGVFKAHERILECKKCGNNESYGSEQLAKMKPFRGTFGYDVLVHVGEAVFLRWRSEKEIQCELEEKNVRISERELSYLARKFVVYLVLAHRQSREKIRSLMKSRGGYILHLDATCEGDSPHLMSGLDGISEIVLENTKLASEKAEKIIPFLRNIKRLYGEPLASVHDMGKGISNALQEVFPDSPDFICHYHFLADLGKDLFGEENDKIRARLRKHAIQGKLRKRVREYKRRIDENPALVESLAGGMKENNPSRCTSLKSIPLVISYTLVLWALEGKKQAQGYGFPFDRAYLAFYQRLKTLHATLRWLRQRHWENRKDAKPYITICRDLIDTLEDPLLPKTAKKMQEKTAVFDKLREAMRITMPNGKHGLNDRGEQLPIHAIERAVEEFCKCLDADETLCRQEDYKSMMGQIKQYWRKLFSDPLLVDTPMGKMAIQPQRTNNILERLFREIKRSYRKKSGSKALGKILKAMLSDTPLVKNLQNPEYLKIILDGKANLQERFSEIDAQLVQKELLNQQAASEKVPPKIKKMIKLSELPEALIALFAG